MSTSKAQTGRPVRMVAVDMDGTLLGEDGQVSARNLAALRAAHDAGITVVVATGRRHCYAMRVLRDLELHHETALVSSNGTVTRTIGSQTIPTELVARTHLPHTTSRWLLEHVREFRDALVITFDRVDPDGEDSRGALVVEHLAELHVSIGRWMIANEPYIAHVQPIDSVLGDESEPAIQMMLCGTVERMRKAEARLLEHPAVLAHGMDNVPGLHQVAIHRTEYPDRDLSILDILPAGCSKGEAILSIAAARGIRAQDIMAIGDNWNDVPMFEVAGTVRVMENAPEDLKCYARTRGWHIGGPNSADGVAEALEGILPLAPAGEVVG